MTIKLDGKAVAAAVKADLAKRVADLTARGGQPGLGTILVGDDPGSVKYVAGKHADCAEVGIHSVQLRLPADASQEQVLQAVNQLNEDPDCTGFIVQLPLPAGIDQQAVIEAVDPAKDADGMHPYNLGQLVLDTSGKNLAAAQAGPGAAAAAASFPLPCTPQGILALLEAYQIDLQSKEICLLGRGITVGRSIGLLLTSRAVNATVTLCHTGTVDVRRHMRQADVIIAAMGQAGFVRPEDVREGAVLVDVGVSRVFDQEAQRWRVVGDVDKAAHQKAGAYTPNPGGVGPMTRAMLLSNVVAMAERAATAAEGH
ncbi:bifunctional methylenetetrahydrofolate dehydrogenase/methenyltetrahydrofolate cyclohydrolase [Bifidobacterium aemilianum]|uniref:Bifunctional protein FolD n=1 Tax=Bifidobacterium aemilianum TaxID=2493120 RepID=A0A366KA99_9BIFI|nr:bifunctional methylenetetrahydrofolate dehydrogenase/methenyltetrahydrofolate cyclohydrolase [Bifidobacterium aemilianum]RBP98656.1 bifunctional methylenetetrahydrofolate dehydrogenase/methenyltetrahydrofolate cyclohydrolase [Bifidobacterium aemilianum]